MKSEVEALDLSLLQYVGNNVVTVLVFKDHSPRLSSSSWSSLQDWLGNYCGKEL